MRWHTALAMLCTAVCIAGSTGCTTQHQREDVEAFVREELGLSGCTVYVNTRSVIGGDGYEDIIWTVRTPGEGACFHVIDDFGWEAEMLTNRLITDYDASMLRSIREGLPTLPDLTLELYQEEGLVNTAYLIGSYHNREELAGCIRQLELLRRAFADLGYPNLAVGYRLEYHHPLRSRIPGRTMVEGDYFSSTDRPVQEEELVRRFAYAALLYRLDQLEELTPQEIARTAREHGGGMGVQRGQQVVFYDDILEQPGGGVSFGTLYELLVREGQQVQGSAWSYSFCGPGGERYDVSYDLCAGQGSGQPPGYYYLQEGERQPLSSPERPAFSLEQVQQLTGLRLTTEHPDR